MDSAQLRSQLKHLIVGELNLKGRDPETIEDDAPLFGTGLGLDSLDAVNILFEVEGEFNISISDEQARGIKSVRQMVEGVGTLLGEKKTA